MLRVTMSHAAHTEPFVEFLDEQTEYKTINMDQWTGFLRFTQEVSFCVPPLHAHTDQVTSSLACALSCVCRPLKT